MLHFVTVCREDTISLHTSLVHRERKVTHPSLVAKERRESGNEVHCVPDYRYSTMINNNSEYTMASMTTFGVSRIATALIRTLCVSAHLIASTFVYSTFIKVYGAKKKLHLNLTKSAT